MLAVLRRRLPIATWVIVSTQSLVLALGTAQVCAAGEHTHGGKAAPDCAMHHHGGSAAHETEGGPHHDHTASHSAPADTAVPFNAVAQLTCRCSNEVPSMFLGHAAIIERSFNATPPLPAVALSPAAVDAYSDRDVSPASPPPRSATR